MDDFAHQSCAPTYNAEMYLLRDFATMWREICAEEKFAPSNSVREWNPRYSPEDRATRCIFPSRILPRGRGTPGIHIHTCFSAKRGTKFRRRSSLRTNATFYYGTTTSSTSRERARSVEPKRPRESASIFCPRQRFLFSTPLIPRGRSSFTGQRRPDALVSYNCLVSTRKKNCAVGTGENFRRENDALVSRCANENKKKKGRERGKKGRQRERELTLSSSISVDRIPKRKRTSHLPPSTSATAAGPLRRAEMRIAACLCSRLGFCPRRRRTDEEMRACPTRSVRLATIFMNSRYTRRVIRPARDDCRQRVFRYVMPRGKYGIEKQTGETITPRPYFACTRDYFCETVYKIHGKQNKVGKNCFKRVQRVSRCRKIPSARLSNFGEVFRARSLDKSRRPINESFVRSRIFLARLKKHWDNDRRDDMQRSPL